MDAFITSSLGFFIQILYCFFCTGFSLSTHVYSLKNTANLTYTTVFEEISHFAINSVPLLIIQTSLILSFLNKKNHEFVVRLNYLSSFITTIYIMTLVMHYGVETTELVLLKSACIVNHDNDAFINTSIVKFGGLSIFTVFTFILVHIFDSNINFI